MTDQRTAYPKGTTCRRCGYDRSGGLVGEPCPECTSTDTTNGPWRMLTDYPEDRVRSEYWWLLTLPLVLTILSMLFHRMLYPDTAVPQNLGGSTGIVAASILPTFALVVCTLIVQRLGRAFVDTILIVWTTAQAAMCVLAAIVMAAVHSSSGELAYIALLFAVIYAPVISFACAMLGLVIAVLYRIQRRLAQKRGQPE